MLSVLLLVTCWPKCEIGIHIKKSLLYNAHIKNVIIAVAGNYFLQIILAYDMMQLMFVQNIIIHAL